MPLASSGPIETKKLLKPLAMSLVTATLLIVRQSFLFSELPFRKLHGFTTLFI